MASAAASPKHVDESLWWDSFVGLFGELDKVPPSKDPPDHLVVICIPPAFFSARISKYRTYDLGFLQVENLKRHRAWFLNSIAYFKPPDQTSRLALDSPELAVGSHRLLVKSELRKDALRVSEYMVFCLLPPHSFHSHPNTVTITRGSTIRLVNQKLSPSFEK